MSLERFMLALDDPNRTFSPGETVGGKIFFDVRRRKIRVTALKVGIRGRGKVQWIGNERNHASYGDEELYFQEELYILGPSDEGFITIEAGCHVLPFKFLLPYNIPSSFETTDGSISYAVGAKLVRPLEVDCERTIPFTVETPLILGQSMTELTPIKDEQEFTFGLFNCLNAAAINFNVFLPSNGFAVGEDIEATIDICNMSTSVDVETIELQLEQKVTLIASSPAPRTKSYTDIVQRAKKEGPFGETDKTVLSMRVPPLPHSGMIHCNFIDVAYRLKVIAAVSGGHKDVEMEYPIAIGTKPALLAHRTPVNSATIPEFVPTAPFIPEESLESEDAMTMPISGDAMTIPMPMPISVPYSPAHGEEITENTSNELNPPAPGFSSAISNPGVAPVNTPYPTGNTPYPVCNMPFPIGHTPYPRGNTPYPRGNTPYPPTNPGSMGFVAPTSAQTSFSTDSTAPPSYEEAVGNERKTPN